MWRSEIFAQILYRNSYDVEFLDEDMTLLTTNKNSFLCKRQPLSACSPTEHGTSNLDMRCKVSDSIHCKQMPNLNALLQRRLSSYNYRTTCYLSSVVMGLVSFKSTQFIWRLFEDDALCGSCSRRGESYSATESTQNKSKILGLLKQIHLDVTDDRSSVGYGRWPYHDLFYTLRKCMSLGLDEKEDLGDWGDANSVLFSILDIVVCPDNYDAIFYLGNVDTPFETFVINELDFKHNDILVITNDGEGTNICHFEGYNTLFIIVYRNVHYTSYLQDLRTKKWHHFDSAHGLIVGGEEAPPLQDYDTRWTYYLEKK